MAKRCIVDKWIKFSGLGVSLKLKLSIKDGYVYVNYRPLKKLKFFGRSFWDPEQSWVLCHMMPSQNGTEYYPFEDSAFAEYMNMCNSVYVQGTVIADQVQSNNNTGKYPVAYPVS